jgi:hypothetical protein
MPKKIVSARVPPEVSDGVDEFAERKNLNNTDALTELLEFALEHHPGNQVGGEEVDPERVYTVELTPKNDEHINEADVTPEEAINNVLNIYS